MTMKCYCIFNNLVINWKEMILKKSKAKKEEKKIEKKIEKKEVKEVKEEERWEKKIITSAELAKMINELMR